MAIKIEDKTKCTGCTACQAVCPVNCITMKEDECGFKYPIVSEEKCIACHQCEKVCPMIGEHTHTNKPQAVYAAWSKDSDIRFESTSGGIFSELANKVILNGGFVVGASYGENNVIEHIIINSIDDLKKIRQSKYAQSDVEGIYKKIKALSKERKLLFCGTPCQVAGLKNFLHIPNDNVITVDFVCRGVNSPKAFQEWLREIEKNHNSKVERVWFKYKVHGWHNSPRCTFVQFKNGEEEIYSGKNNTFMCGYLGPNLYIRKSCGSCIFKGEERVSDITLGDFWGVDEKLDDNKGTSIVIVNTEQGKKMLDGIIKRIVINKRELNEVLKGNMCFENSVKINKKSESFLCELGTEKFSKLLSRYSSKTALEVVEIMGERLVKKLQKGFLRT